MQSLILERASKRTFSVASRIGLAPRWTGLTTAFVTMAGTPDTKCGPGTGADQAASGRSGVLRQYGFRGVR